MKFYFANLAGHTRTFGLLVTTLRTLPGITSQGINFVSHPRGQHIILVPVAQAIVFCALSCNISWMLIIFPNFFFARFYDHLFLTLYFRYFQAINRLWIFALSPSWRRGISWDVCHTKVSSEYSTHVIYNSSKPLLPNIIIKLTANRLYQ